MPRDAILLLRQFRSTLAFVPFVAGGVLASSCTTQPSPTADATTSDHERANDKPNSPRNVTATTLADRTDATAEVETDIESAVAEKTTGMPIKGVKLTLAQRAELAGIPSYLIGDPPLVEGYDAEESTCVAGNWCGPVAAATALASIRAEQVDGCPDRLLGRHEDAVDLSQKVYRGMSQKSSMRGKLQTWRTQREREARKSADICCYHWFNYCSGRPVPEFADFDSAKASGLPGWQRTRRVSKSSLEDRPRAEIADELALQWLHDAHDEHASVAAFARTILELIAVGAPAELLTSHQRAMADEIEHAQACYQLAARFGVDQAGPAALPLLMPRAGGLTSVALAALHEACIGETIAALRAKRQLQHCEDPSTRKALQRIAHDEAKHAALGWQTLRWALANGDEQLVASLRNEIAQLQQQWAGASDRSILPGSPNELANWGRLNAEQIDACQRDAWRCIIEPMLRDLTLA